MAEQTEQRLADFKDNAAGALATIAANNTAVGVSRAPEADRGMAAAMSQAAGVAKSLERSMQKFGAEESPKNDGTQKDAPGLFSQNPRNMPGRGGSGHGIG